MVEALKKDLLPGMAVFDLRNTLEEVSKNSQMKVNVKKYVEHVMLWEKRFRSKILH